jgi:hypothetical protein
LSGKTNKAALSSIIEKGSQHNGVSSREWDILVTPKTRGVAASPYKAIDTPISHIWAYPPPLFFDFTKFKIKKKTQKK